MGTVTVALDEGTDPASVGGDRGIPASLPFTIEGTELRFFAGAPGTVRVLTGDRETVYSLTLAGCRATRSGRPPQNVRRGIPRASVAKRLGDRFLAVARAAGRIRIADRLAAVRTQPGISIARRENGRSKMPYSLEESFMTFDRAWVLAIAWLPLAWMVFEWRRTSRRLALVLKALSLVAILFALAEPRLNIFGDQSRRRGSGGYFGQRFSDRSRSCLAHRRFDRDRARPPLDAGDSVCAVDPSLDRSEDQKPWNLLPTAGEAGRATDLEAAIREAAASLPAGMVPRIALISDGKQNKGSIARAAWQAQQLGIPIDTFAMKGRRSRRCVWNRSACRRSRSRANNFPSIVVVSTPKAGPAEVELSRGRPHAGQDAGAARRRRKSAAAACQPEYARRAGSFGRRFARSGAGRSPLRSGGDAAPAQGSVRHRRRGQREFASDRDAGGGAVRGAARQRYSRRRI